jgi:alpha-tubulin suppressor-like RCC1 family protein
MGYIGVSVAAIQEINIVEQNQKTYIKCTQVAAGFQSSLCLMSNGKVYLWGTTKLHNLLTQPKQIQLFQEQQLYHVIQIRGTWSRTMSILYAVLADSRQVVQNNNLIQKVCHNLSNQWNNNSCNIYLLYII